MYPSQGLELGDSPIRSSEYGFDIFDKLLVNVRNNHVVRKRGWDV